MWLAEALDVMKNAVVHDASGIGILFYQKKRQFILSNFVDCSAKNGTEHPLPINRGVG